MKEILILSHGFNVYKTIYLLDNIKIFRSIEFIQYILRYNIPYLFYTVVRVTIDWRGIRQWALMRNWLVKMRLLLCSWYYFGSISKMCLCNGFGEINISVYTFYNVTKYVVDFSVNKMQLCFHERVRGIAILFQIIHNLCNNDRLSWNYGLQNFSYFISCQLLECHLNALSVSLRNVYFSEKVRRLT